MALEIAKRLNKISYLPAAVLDLVNHGSEIGVAVSCGLQTLGSVHQAGCVCPALSVRLHHQVALEAPLAALADQEHRTKRVIRCHASTGPFVKVIGQTKDEVDYASTKPITFLAFSCDDNEMFVAASSV